jgi:hypothetical protein
MLFPPRSGVGNALLAEAKLSLKPRTHFEPFIYN